MSVKRSFALIGLGFVFLPVSLLLQLAGGRSTWVGISWLSLVSWILLVGWGVYCAALYRPGESKLLHLLLLHAGAVLGLAVCWAGFSGLLGVLGLGLAQLVELCFFFPILNPGLEVLFHLPIPETISDLAVVSAGFVLMALLSLLCCGVRWLLSRK